MRSNILLLVFLSILIAITFRVDAEDDLSQFCKNCRWNINMGFTNYPFDCSKYIICVRTFNSPHEFQTFLRDCPANTYWNHDLVTCTTTIPPMDKCDFIEVNTNPIPTPVGCELQQGPTKRQYIFKGILRTCPADTEFIAEECACILIAPPACDRQVRTFNVPFDHNFNDIGCNKVVGEPQGNVTISNIAIRGKGSACFQKDGFLSYSLFNNLFNGNEVNSFTFVLFVLSDEKGFFEREGLVSHRDCDTNQSPFDITIGPRTGIHCQVITDDGIGDVWGNFNPGVWTKIALRYNGEFLDLLIDGILIDQSTGAKGNLRNSKCPRVLGWRGIFEDDGLYKGYIDDIRNFPRALTNQEIQNL